MKTISKMILAGAIFGYLAILLFLSPFVHGQEVQDNEAYKQLVRDAESASYHKNDYKTDRFDCSNMAGVLVDHLDSLGYNAEIIVVQAKQEHLDKYNMIGRPGYHAFVIVDRQAIIESTYKLVTFTEGKYGKHGSIDWYIGAWNVIEVHTSMERACKDSRWGMTEWARF